MEQIPLPAAFEVRIEACENFTWQGKLIADGQATAFRSELELLLAIDQLLGGNEKISGQWNELN